MPRTKTVNNPSAVVIVPPGAVDFGRFDEDRDADIDRVIDSMVLGAEGAMEIEREGEDDHASIDPERADEPMEMSPPDELEPEEFNEASLEAPGVPNAAVAASAVEQLSPDMVDELMKQLTPAKLEAIRMAAIKAGLPPLPQERAGRGPACRIQRDGSMLLTVVLPREVAEPLQVWAESAGEPLGEFIGKITVDSVTSYVFQDFGSTGAGVTAQA